MPSSGDNMSSDSYEVLVVEKNKDVKIKNQIINLWVNNKILPLNEALNRINYVVLAIRHIESDTIIGVSTAKIDIHPLFNKFYYFYGMYVDPNHSKRPLIFQRTFDYLNDNHMSSIKGVVAVLENQKISDKILNRYHWHKIDDEVFSNRAFYRNFDENSQN